jgi:hypothetical protein
MSGEPIYHKPIGRTGVEVIAHIPRGVTPTQELLRAAADHHAGVGRPLTEGEMYSLALSISPAKAMHQA